MTFSRALNACKKPKKVVFLSKVGIVKWETIPITIEFSYNPNARYFSRSSSSPPRVEIRFMLLANIFFYTKVKVDSSQFSSISWNEGLFRTCQTWERVTDFNIYFDSNILGLKLFGSWHLIRWHPKGCTRTVRWVGLLLRATRDIWVEFFQLSWKLDSLKHPIDQGFGLEERS